MCETSLLQFGGARALAARLRSAFFLLATATVLALSYSSPSTAEPDAFAYNRLLGRGINLGNALDAPTEGAWGVTLKAEYFKAIKKAGFNSVRIPIRWSAHALQDPPYTIDPAFLKRVDWAIEQALSRNLAVVINVHHYLELNKEPATQAPRLVALWKQIAARYHDRPRTLFFELLNEPSDELTDERWQQIFPDVLRAIRETNPMRIVIVGPAEWNSPEHLPRLSLPSADRALIATFHYYSPLHFTHQGASWVANTEGWLGTKWGTEQDKSDLRNDFEKIASWGRQNARPIYMGEFGSIDKAEMESRALWTSAVAREAEKLGFSWSYWEFCDSFGVYDRKANAWRLPLLKALLDKEAR
jgi:endoglucanase